MVSLPPRPLIRSRSVVPMSRLNRPRLTRSKSHPAPFAAMVNSSPARVEPLTSTVSMPAPPSITSVPSPLFQTIRSLPRLAEHRVVAAVADEHVVAGIAAQRVVAGAAVDGVVAASGEDLVVARGRGAVRVLWSFAFRSRPESGWSA